MRLSDFSLAYLGRLIILTGYIASFIWLQWRLHQPMLPSKRPLYWFGSVIALYAACFYGTVLFFDPRITEAWIIASQVTHWLVLGHVIVVAVTSD